MKKILWLAPNLNHYKSRFLEVLNSSGEIDVTVIAGKSNKSFGYSEETKKFNFNLIQTDVPRQKFGFSRKILNQTLKLIPEYDFILVPIEKKNLFLSFLLIFLNKLKGKNKAEIISYNHPHLKSGNAGNSAVDIFLTKILFALYDRIIFYSEKSKEKAVSEELIDEKKAFWANNTIDTNQINSIYNFTIKSLEKPSILFIGRLIANKNINDIFDYYYKLRENINKNLTLQIIGDGPEYEIVKNHSNSDENIIWHGSIIDENKIASIMEQINFVFIPGHSGLSIVHSFAYGKPYVTSTKYKKHPPEFSYLKDGYNGLVLSGNDEDINKLKRLLTNFDYYKHLCENAKKTSEYLSIENWVNQFSEALKS